MKRKNMIMNLRGRWKPGSLSTNHKCELISILNILAVMPTRAGPGPVQAVLQPRASKKGGPQKKNFPTPTKISASFFLLLHLFVFPDWAPNGL